MTISGNSKNSSPSRSRVNILFHLSNRSLRTTIRLLSKFSLLTNFCTVIVSTNLYSLQSCKIKSKAHKKEDLKLLRTASLNSFRIFLLPLRTILQVWPIRKSIVNKNKGLITIISCKERVLNHSLRRETTQLVFRGRMSSLQNIRSSLTSCLSRSNKDILLVD